MNKYIIQPFVKERAAFDRYNPWIIVYDATYLTNNEVIVEALEEVILFSKYYIPSYETENEALASMQMYRTERFLNLQAIDGTTIGL